MKKIALVVCCSLIVVFGSLFHVSAQPKALSIATLNFPPISDEKAPGYGFIGELFHEVFEPYGYAVNIKVYPWARAFELSKQGEIVVGIFPSIYNEEREQWFFYSDPIMTTGYVLITRKDTGITTYDSLDEFTHMTIGVLRSGVTGSAIDTAEYTKEEGNNFEMNIRKLLGRRFDLITGEYMAMMNVINNKFAGNKDELVVIDPPISTIDFYLMISKHAPNAAKILEDCNQGIATIIQNGRLDELKLKYGIR